VAQITWPASVSAQLNAYTQRLQEEAIQAASDAVAFIHERTVERARVADDWSPIADAIEVWSQDGRLVIGVRDDEFASQAFALEYGDEVRPPSPLFRTLTADMEDAAQKMGEQMEAKFGYGGRFGAASGTEGSA